MECVFVMIVAVMAVLYVAVLLSGTSEPEPRVPDSHLRREMDAAIGLMILDEMSSPDGDLFDF